MSDRQKSLGGQGNQPPGQRPAGGGALQASAKAAAVKAQGHVGMPAARWVQQAIRLQPASLRKRRTAFLLRLLVFVVAPTLLTTGYVYWYATPRFVSETQITYQSNDPSAQAASAGLLSSIMGSSASGTDMSQVLQAYLTSAAAAELVDKDVRFRQHCSNRKIDWLDRLSTDATAEQYLKYFNRRVTVTRQFGGYVTLDVEAFDPAFSQKVGKSLVKAADSMVAKMMERARFDAVSLASAELKRTEDELRVATMNTTTFRNRHSDVNIQGSAASLDTVVSTLESQVSQATSDLADAKTFLSDNAPSVVTLSARIAALKDQIQTERKRLGYADAGGKPVAGKLPYSQIVAEFASLQTEEKFATDSYVSAKKALDLARSLAAQKSGYVVNFVPPSLPQASMSPDPLTYILSAFLASLFSYMIGTLLIGVFQDRAGA